MPPKNRKPISRWSIHPELHGDVSRLLSEDELLFSFYKNDSDSESIRDYDTNIMGRFVCHNQKCTSHGWSSKKIAITVRLYSKQRYNARVYHQRCQQCNAISKPHLNDTYAERVAYRLKGGMGWRWRRQNMEVIVKGRTKANCVRDAGLDIAIKLERDLVSDMRRTHRVIA